MKPRTRDLAAWFVLALMIAAGVLALALIIGCSAPIASPSTVGGPGPTSGSAVWSWPGFLQGWFQNAIFIVGGAGAGIAGDRFRRKLQARFRCHKSLEVSRK